MTAAQIAEFKGSSLLPYNIAMPQISEQATHNPST